jgi:hypothetical protein
VFAAGFHYKIVMIAAGGRFDLPPMRDLGLVLMEASGDADR